MASDSMAQYFYHHDINLFDDDIREIVQSRGLIGVEFDQRVNGVKGEHPGQLIPEMIWHNIRYIAEAATKYLADGQSAWDILSLGTDFDGVINPMEKCQTAGMIGSLRLFIKPLLHDYLAGACPLGPQDKALDADVILDKLFFGNILSFAAKYYI